MQTTTPATTTKNTDRLFVEIRKDADHRAFFKLLEGEPKLDILGFARKIYKKDHNAATVTTYSRGVNVFREMIAPKTLGEFARRFAP